MSLNCSLKDRKNKPVSGGACVGEGQTRRSPRKKEKQRETKAALAVEAAKRGIPVHQLVAERHAEAFRIKAYPPGTITISAPSMEERHHFDERQSRLRRSLYI